MTQLGSNVNPAGMGAVTPDAIQVDSYEGALFAQRITEIPSNLQMRVGYDTLNRMQYVGYGARGLASSDNGWIIHKFSYDGITTRANLRQSAYDSWDNRETATFA